MQICTACGTRALSASAPCARCGGLSVVTAPETSAGWIGIRATFTCRGCGHRAPLDHLDIDGSVDCPYCGLSQRFEAVLWRPVLAALHALADLGASAEGRHPHAQISIASSNPHWPPKTPLISVEERHKGEDGVNQVLRAEASLGHPTCPRGHGPLRIEGGRETLCSCSACDFRARYPKAPDFFSPLSAILSNEGRTDLAPAKTVQHEGILSLTCPSCGAPLPATEGSRIVECSFCHLVSRLPGDTGKGKARSMPAPQLWWLAFSGPSLRRKELEKGPERDARSLEEAPLRKDTDPVGQGLKWAPILLFPSIALLLTGLVCLALWRTGMLG